MTGTLARILGAPVRIEDACVGRVAGVVGDSGFTRVIGFDVVGSDGTRKFLPWVAATVAGGEVCASSSLVLFETHEIEAYARRGAVTVRSPIELDRLVVASDGTVEVPPVAGVVSREPAPGTSTV